MKKQKYDLDAILEKQARSGDHNAAVLLELRRSGWNLQGGGWKK